MRIEKTVALIECYEHLENAFNEVTKLDTEDEKLTAIWWEIKNVINSVDKYIEELNK